MNTDKAFALTKAAAVEQLSDEVAEEYSSGFALAPLNAILYFTITGLATETEVAVAFSYSSTTVSKNVTTDESGTATFAIGVEGGKYLNDCTLTVGDNAITLVSSSKQVESGKIYNINRSVAPAGNTVDLSALTGNYEAQSGDVLTGTLGGNYKITIADGATVTLKDAVINGTNSNSYSWAGLTLVGDATIILSGTNSVKGFYEDYPGIYVPENKTVTIKGDGSLTATGGGYGAGIGGGWEISCGNITIEGGTITATGGNSGAGIGSGDEASCGNITITGGTITATGGEYAVGIGSGSDGASCGDITITDGVTSVTATAGNMANSIGAGLEGTVGTVTITAASGKVVQN